MKKYLMLFAVLVMAIGVYSFTTSNAKSPTPLVQTWYDFVGDDPNDPMDYQLRTGTAPSCNSGSNRCAVKAVQDTDLPGNLPDLQDPSIVIRNKP
jgi:hypothetical protein